MISAIDLLDTFFDEEVYLKLNKETLLEIVKELGIKTPKKILKKDLVFLLADTVHQLNNKAV